MIPKDRAPDAAEKRIESTCPAEFTLKVIAGKWKVLIIWHLMSGTRRFNELRKSLPAITPRMLARQLRELESDRVLARKVYAEIPPRVEYTLTTRGRTLSGVVEEMCKWGRKAR
jgi:DNA-binding HxlR family transcriptional regulator